MSGRPVDELRVPKLFNLRSDPLEKGDTSILYDKWMAGPRLRAGADQVFAAQWLSSFGSFRRGEAGENGFNLDEVNARSKRHGRATSKTTAGLASTIAPP